MTTLDLAIGALDDKCSELDIATDALTDEIRKLSHRLTQTHATTSVWLDTKITETDPDLPGSSLTWLVGYASVRKPKNEKDPLSQTGRIWCLCAKRMKIDKATRAPVEVMRTCTLDSAPRHVRAAAVAVLPQIVKDLYYTTESHTANVVRAAEQLKAYNAGKEA